MIGRFVAFYLIRTPLIDIVEIVSHAIFFCV